MVKQNLKVFGWMNCIDSPWVERLRLEVLHVEGHNRLRLGMDGCGKNVTVLWMVLARVDEAFIAGDYGVWKEPYCSSDAAIRGRF